jgi:Uma2 family endonuclease
MGVMTIADAWPSTARPFTTYDLDRMPDDGHRYELLDGVLVVSPRPAPVHQVVASRLGYVLRQRCPARLEVVPEPAMMVSADTEFDPDIIVIGLEHIRGKKITDPPLLAAEIRSPSTALFDLNTKKAVYERFGIESYWIVVPDLDQPELIVFELRDGRYEQVAHVTGDEPFRAERPFTVEVVPSLLVARLFPA